MAQVIRYVDPDATGEPINGQNWDQAYRSLSAWNAAEATNLVTAGNYHTAYCRSSGGTDDTTPFNLTGWTTGAANYIEIIGADFPVDGIFDSTKYVLHNNNSDATTLTVSMGYVYLINLQILITSTNTTARNGIAANGTNCTIDSCIVKAVCSSTATIYGLRFGARYNATINTIIYDCTSGASRGVYSTNAADSYFYNSTVFNCVTGLYIHPTSARNSIINCAVGNCTDDIYSASPIDYCCTDDGDGTNAQGPLDGDWANEFTNASGGDFSLVSGGNCIGNGTDDPSTGLYSDDIIGTVRSSVWDIGAFEYVGAPPVAGRPMVYLFDLP